MKQRLPIVLSVTALVVAVLGVTGLGEAALRAVPFALNAGKVNGIQASRVPAAGKLLALNRLAKFPKSVLPLTAGPPGPAGPAGPAGPTGAQGPPGTPPVGNVADVKVFTDTDAHSTNSTSFVDVPGASVSIDVPTGQTARLNIRYTAETQCTGGSWCSARVIVNGTEADPTSGLDFAMASPGGEPWVGAAMDRTANNLAAGTYTVKVQYAVVGAATFRLDDSSLTVERVRLS